MREPRPLHDLEAQLRAQDGDERRWPPWWLILIPVIAAGMAGFVLWEVWCFISLLRP